jgi:hypothetical protein
MRVSSFFILLFILFVIVFLGGRCECPLVPADEDDYTLEATETIGAAGGTLEVEDFSLSVPAGAFDSDVELKLYASEDDQPFGDNSISRTFKIEGLPDVYDGVLHLRIKYQGTISEQGYIAIGEEAFAPSLGEVTTDYRLVQSVDSAGYLICDLKSPDEDIRKSPRMYKTSKPGFLERYYGAVYASIPKTSPEGHFKITDAWGMEAKAESLLTYFENAYDMLQSMGFSYTDRKKWPVEVIIRSFRVAGGFVIPIAGKFTRNRRGYDYGQITINGSFAENKDLMRTISGHEFFHLVQWLYDSRPESISYEEPYPHYWLDEATAVWSEEKYSELGPQNYVSRTFKGFEMEPFKGMQKDYDKNNKGLARDHGYGMPGLVKYLLRTYGEDKLVKIYEGIQAGNHPVDAIISNTESPGVWLEPFFREYILGNIYNIEPSKWWAEHEGEFTIDSKDDKLKTFSHTYQDLSGKLFRILLEYPSLNSDVKIRFTVNGGDNSEVTVFKYSDVLGEIRCLGNSTSEVSVSEIKNLMDTGWDLLALVTNTRHESPYTGSSETTLKVELIKSFAGKIKFFLMLDGTIHVVRFNGDEYDNEGPFSVGTPNLLDTLFSINVSESTYVQTWDVQADDDTWKGNLTVTLNSEHKKIVSYELSYEEAVMLLIFQ